MASHPTHFGRPVSMTLSNIKCHQNCVCVTMIVQQMFQLISQMISLREELPSVATAIISAGC